MPKALREQDEPIPYMHIFALINLLKQICYHPSLLEKDAPDYRKYTSSKWDLFTERLEEASSASGI